ncbi:hypothetical protein JCM10213_000379 [Rhodosporidiobolus nylandii]
MYLFAAIDARNSKGKEGARGAAANGRAPRPRFHPDELKRLIVEASEAVDDKSAASDFQETLERIVNEIKNTTEHSGPFLQKVRKADVPDYYDVIKRPMDLGTLLKKVRQQTYRTKKAFAEDLDLIWSNCLLYNSHPAHPLRTSAEALRAKSNQLLEFITDPAVTQRTLFAASVSSAALDGRRGSSVRIGTPDEDGDADGESDDERRSKRALSERLLNGVNGDYRDSSASPAPSRSQTPAVGRRLSRKISQGPLGRISPSPEPLEPTELPFEERPAFIRTAESMHSFLLLDAELSRLEGSGFKPSATSASSVLPPTAFDSPAASSSSAALNKRSTRVASHIQRLNSSILPPPPPARPETNGATPSASVAGETDSATATPAALPVPPPAPKRNPDEPLEAVWWDVVGAASSSSALFPPASSSAIENGADGEARHAQKDPLPLPALAAGMPRVPWVGYRATPYDSATGTVALKAKGGAKGKGKGKAVEPGPEVAGEKVSTKKQRKKQLEGAEEKGLAPRMRKNCETLRKIRSVGARLAREGSAAGELDAPEPLSSDDDSDLDSLPNGHGEAMDVDGEKERPKKRRRLTRSVAASTSVPRKAFRCPATAPTAARESLRAAAGGVLGHAGFEGAGAGALDVLTHLAGEYLTNLGRTLRFYSDRCATELSPKEMLTHTLSENGVPTPAALESYVTEDIDRYGSRLSDLLRRLERAREEQLDAAVASPSAAMGVEADELADDEAALASGEFARKIGEDFFGLDELDVDVDGPASASLALPAWLLKGVARPETTDTAGSLTYSPPPGFIPLIPEAIPSQIGLLQPYYTLRASRPDISLLDDVAASALNPVRPKGSTRHKVPPHGRIPFKGKKRPEDPTLPAAMAAAAAASAGEPVKKKKKSKAAQAVVAATGVLSPADSGAE